MRYLKVIGVLIVQSFQKEAAFRTDFWLNALSTLLGLVGGLGGIYVLFAHSDTLNGWDQFQTISVFGVYLLVNALKNVFVGPSLSALAGLDGMLWTGDFDEVLLKPVPTQLYVSTHKWSPWALCDLAVAGIVLYLAVSQSGEIGLLSIIVFIGTMISALVMLYSILLVLAAAAFWYLGTPLMWILDSFMQTGRFPIRIYPQGIQLLLTWIVPIGLIVTLPAEALLSKADPLLVVVSGALGAVFFILSAKFFRLSVNRYSSASS